MAQILHLIRQREGNYANNISSVTPHVGSGKSGESRVYDDLTLTALPRGGREVVSDRLSPQVKHFKTA